jgi:hypothetical protein
MELVKSLHPVVHADELENSFPTGRLSGILTQGLHRSIPSFVVVQGASAIRQKKVPHTLFKKLMRDPLLEFPGIFLTGQSIPGQEES